MYTVAFKSQDNKHLDLSVVGDAGYTFILPWMPVPVSMVTLTQVVSGSSTVVARAAIGREIPDLKHLALTVDGMQARVYFRGRLLMTGTLSTTMTIDKIELQGGSRDTLLSEMLLMPRVAEPEDIAMWYNLRAPFYDPSPHIPAEHQPVTVKGAGADIDIDKYGIRATRKADGKKTFEINAETGDVHFEGDGVFRGRVEANEGYFHGRVEAEEGYFRGDITGATGTFSGELAAKSIKADWYADIRNVIAFSGEGILDANHPYEYSFEIPSETTKIVQIKMSARAERFRTYASGAASGGGATPTSSVQETQVSSAAGLHHHALVSVPASTSPVTDNLEHWHRYVTVDFEQVDASTSSSTTGATVGIYDPGHNHSVGAIGGTGEAGDPPHSHTAEVHGTASNSSAGVSANINDPGHSHSYTKTNISYAPEDTGGALSGERTHSHEYWKAAALSEGGGEHTHTVPAHSHTVELPSHTHDLVYDIYEDTTPDQVLLYCDNGAGYGEPIALAVAPPDSTVPYVLCSEKELTSFFTTPGWKRIKLTSNRRGRITFQITAKLDITA